MDEGLGQETLFEVLAARVKSLADNMVLMIVEFAGPGVVAWEVRRDQCGTPRGRHWQPVPWGEFYDQDALSGTRLGQFMQRFDRPRLLLICSETHDPAARRAFAMAMAMADGTPAFACQERFEELLGRVLAAAPLTQWYELIALRQALSGRLVFTSIPLFPPGARRGDRKPFSIRCEPGDEYGTVFALAAIESADRNRLLSLQSVNLTAGTYNLTAELRRPGVVRFDGLPATLRPEGRGWPALIASVPDQLHPLHPSHLICAVEVSGTVAQVRDRLDRVDQLIRTAARGTEQRLSVSLITYGSHAVHWDSPGEPTRVLTWAQTGVEALEQLWRLEGRDAADIGYPRAAQLECALTGIAERLTGQEGRPVLVTVGSRPAFPPRVDPKTEIIPCPDKNDWRRALHRLLEHPGIAFGAISEHNPDEGIWTSLGSDAFAPVNAFDPRRFAAELGLASVNIPFPLVGSEQSAPADGKRAAATSAEKDSATRFVEEIVGIGASHVTMLEQEIEFPGADPKAARNVPAPLRSDSGDVQLAAPLRDNAASVPITIYLSEERIHQQVEAAVEEVLARAGLRIYSREEPRAGSWFRRMWATKSAVARDGGLPAARMADARPPLNDDTATLMANRGLVITALQPTGHAVVRVGAVLIVKAQGIISVRQLTAAQQALLERRPRLAAAPGEILAALTGLPSDETMGGMDFPHGSAG